MKRLLTLVILLVAGGCSPTRPTTATCRPHYGYRYTWHNGVWSHHHWRNGYVTATPYYAGTTCS